MKPLSVLIALTLAGTSAWAKDLSPLLAAMAPMQAVPDSTGRMPAPVLRNYWQALSDVPRMRWKWPVASAVENDGMVGRYVLRDDSPAEQSYTVKIEGDSLYMRRMKIEAWRTKPGMVGNVDLSTLGTVNDAPTIFGPAAVRVIATTCDYESSQMKTTHYSLQRPGHVPVFVRFDRNADSDGTLYNWSIAYTLREVLSDGGPDCERK